VVEVKRSKERLEIIDSFLHEHYHQDGGRFCAESLGESQKYIKSRVQYIGLSASTEEQSVKILKGKLKAKNEEIAELRQKLHCNREAFKDLREENIELICQKHKWKMSIKEEMENVV